MLDFAQIDGNLENTQRLPVLTLEAQLEQALLRERAARVEAAELFRQNTALVKELAQLRHATPAEPRAQALPAPAARHEDTEELLFEVCAALKLTLSKVLLECQMRDLPLICGPAANRALQSAGDKLEKILSDPESRLPAPAAPSAAASIDMTTEAVPSLRIVNLELVRSASPAVHPAH